MSFGEVIEDLVDQSLDPILQAAGSWQRVALAEVADILNGYPWPSSGFSANQGQPVIRIRNVLEGETSTFYEGKIFDEYWVLPGDLLVGMDGDFNCNFWKGPKALLNQRVCKLSIKSKFYEEKFLYYVLPGYLRLINSHTSSVTVKHLSSRTLGEIPLPLPPLAEQKRIVAKLDALSAKSARARTELARIETLVSRYKQALLGKAFNGELTREWRNLVNWPTPVGLKEVAGSFAYGSAAKSRKVGSVPVLRMGNIQNGKLDWSDLVYSDDADEIAKYRLTPGDVIFNRTNSPALVGKTALYCGSRQAIFAGYLIRVVPGATLMSEYLTYALNSPAGREFSWSAKTDGVSQSNISAAKLKEFQLSVPPLEEQHEIVRRIETAFARIDRLAAEAKRALTLVGKLDEAILAKAFRGELVRQDENDEPASVLLERIRAERAAAPKPKRGRARG